MTAVTNRPKTDTGTPMLKMKELVGATNVPKSTILLYVKQGLLPTPVKTSANMAWYAPLCIQRIAFIKQVQSSRRLPLAAIKGLIREMEKGRNVDLYLELQTTVFESGPKKLGPAAFCKTTGLNEDQLKLLCRLELILPLEDGRFNEQDKAMGILFKQSLDLGMTPQDLAFYPKFAKELVEKELVLREQQTKGLGFDENASRTLELTRMARSIRSYVIDRTMQKQLMAYNGLKPSLESHPGTTSNESNKG